MSGGTALTTSREKSRLKKLHLLIPEGRNSESHRLYHESRTEQTVYTGNTKTPAYCVCSSHHVLEMKKEENFFTKN
jgi:hypothetical protein